MGKTNKQKAEDISEILLKYDTFQQETPVM